MRILLWIIALFALAVGLTLFAQLNTGYVLLFLPPWRIEISLNVFAMLTLATIALLYLLLRVVAELGGLPHKVKQYRERQQRDASIQLEREARLAFFEGRYQRAERLASEALNNSENNDAFAVNALLATRAAHQMRDFARRDQYLDKLQQRFGNQHLAAAMMAAELYLDERRYTDAGNALAAAKQISPKLTAALQLELRLRLREENPDAVLRLVEQLAKSEAVDAEQARRIRNQAYLLKLRQQPLSSHQLKDWWNKLPAHDKALPQLIEAVTDSYKQQGEPAMARSLLEETLRNEWSGTLAGRYGSLGLTGEALISQLQQAELWLKQHPEDHLLLLTLGRLCRASALWGKAQTYLEASIAVHPTAVAHAELAELLDSLDKNDAASRHYQASLALALPQASLI
ncbi:heme biosynthesis protein HemY [Iodobacter sp. HSC-16F04]|uniref:Heme biosynthesis protein HemY n=1 Tax=Iodobacter violaceini TaxID=3044271 RepID=A0ABX0KTS8_9NEIS|nr:heme biosynthesis HemY N-terminal domain-containing protein [Iodobacter violacea]NHQ87174.1 heme biosynthesis protein HemY [Iodobacter violacea]